VTSIYRRVAATVTAQLGLWRTVRMLRRPRAGQLLLLGHHRVRPLAGESAHRGDVELVSATPEEFAWQVAYLARHFEPVTCRQIADALDGRRDLPARAVAITFDDGYADFIEYALPILRNAAVPATMFVATDYVSSREPYWFDLVAQMMREAASQSIPHPEGTGSLPDGGSPQSRARGAYQLLKFLKSCPDADRVAYLERLRTECGALMQQASEGLGRSMSWEQMREAHAGGIEIGAHSASHPCLTRIDKAKLSRELEVPKREIEARLGVECPSLAYPFGGRQAFSPEVTEMARESGDRVGVSYLPGVNHLHCAERFGLLRQHVERYTSRSYFEALVSLPEYFQ
jgi:peptidoglycan/xylan/chitin deacetylase (PgdA/CDA1 family)